MQVTIKDYDESSHTGTVLTDDGIEVAFGADAMATNGLRFLRSGQRVSADGDDHLITRLWIVGIGEGERIN